MSVLMKKPETLVDVYRLLPEGTPIQVINNQFYMSPSPAFAHFSIAKTIFLQLNEVVTANNLGEAIYAPVDVYLGDKNAVQPDVFFISNANKHFIENDGVYGAPDIIVEILSPSNKNTDLIKKKAIYEQFGVQEYFIVEPADKSVLSYYLKDGKYAEPKKQKAKLTSKLLRKTFSF
ncbi:Uma2 family endonuclease [Parafilimonas terrae]|uniref:Endonuclease, Uma2 family (Restriction endonuclease fold) n=1 Tax=Parafilimonas terrae TaxID=1465490 RepID=A0A1I5RCV5_9BACT|nr:Uma2 family endonuclease [Parafilimonas terrae]SFP56260.1 Endonuclease, Uma2 family (restriction endonuclease fold) [Parafilimonas terrae]